MRYALPLSLCVIVFGAQITLAAEGEIPRFDITAACSGSGALQTPAKCTQDEQAARDLLLKQWSQFKQSDVSRCIQITTSQAARANYTEFLTCLQAATIEERTPTDPLGPIPTIAK